MSATLSTPSPLVRHHARRVLNFGLHFVLLGMFFLLPDLVSSINGSRLLTMPLAFYLKTVVWIVVFYISYYFTTDPFSSRPHAKLKFILQNLAILVAALAVTMAIWYLLRRAPEPHMIYAPRPRPALSFPPPHHHAFSVGMLMRDALMLILTMALSLAIRLYGKMEKMERERIEAQTRLREAELVELRTQLNPHFLFNTLNSIYALIDIDSSSARNAIHRLSKMLRYMLYDNKGRVTLAEDFQFIDAYVDLMHMRFPSTWPVTVIVDAGNMGSVEIAPLLFVNIIENAFKYGLRSIEQAPLTISLRAADGTVECRTSNGNADTGEHGEGTGLVNLRRRLELQYPGRYSLEIQRGKLYEVCLIVDISQHPVN